MLWSCTSCLDIITLRFWCKIQLLLCFLFVAFLISINIVHFTRADYDSLDIRGQKSGLGFFIRYLLIFAAGNLKEKQEKMTSHLMYQKQDIKVRKILNNFQKVTDFKKDCFLSLIAFATAIL